MELIYKTEKEANKDMEKYASLLIKYPSAIYVGVFKEGDLYEIKTGSSNGKNIDKKELIKYLINNLKKDNLRLAESIQKEENYLENLFDFKILKTYEAKEFRLIEPDDSKKEVETSLCLKGGLHIGNKHKSAGTLGAVFQLEEFPDEYFGISNWHVLAYGIKLGDDIIQPGKNSYGASISSKHECGYLFWRCLDEQREAAFVHFNKLDRFDNHHEKIRTNYCNNILSGKVIPVPNIGEELKNCNRLGQGKREILSRNITVKVYDPKLAPEEDRYIKVFKNQILLKGNFRNGNSGSILTFKDKHGIHAVGLLFGKTITGNFGLANKLSYIFNTTITDFGFEYSKLHYKKNLPKEIKMFTPKIFF